MPRTQNRTRPVGIVGSQFSSEAEARFSSGANLLRARGEFCFPERRRSPTGRECFAKTLSIGYAKHRAVCCNFFGVEGRGYTRGRGFSRGRPGNQDMRGPAKGTIAQDGFQVQFSSVDTRSAKFRTRLRAMIYVSNMGSKLDLVFERGFENTISWFEHWCEKRFCFRKWESILDKLQIPFWLHSPFCNIALVIISAALLNPAVLSQTRQAAKP